MSMDDQVSTAPIVPPADSARSGGLNRPRAPGSDLEASDNQAQTDLPSLPWLLVTSWVPVALGVAVAASTVLGQRAPLLNHLLFLGGYVAATIPLGLVHHAMWRRGLGWTRSVPLLLLASLLVAFATTTILMWCAVHVGTVPGRFRWSYVAGSFDSVWFVLLAFCAMVMVVGYYTSMKQARLRAAQAASLARDAQLRALRYQLHPHFLFNTLNAISTLVVEERTREATRMIARLADFLRATLQGSGTHEVTLAEEIALTESYLDIEKARLGERLTLTVQVEAGTLACAVPWLLLQPLVENGIRHGIAARPEGGRLLLRAKQVGERLKLTIGNDVPRHSTLSKKRDGFAQSVGLGNVRERLRQLYGSYHRFDLDITDAWCEVAIEVPWRPLKAAEQAAWARS